MLAIDPTIESDALIKEGVAVYRESSLFITTDDQKRAALILSNRQETLAKKSIRNHRISYISLMIGMAGTFSVFTSAALGMAVGCLTLATLSALLVYLKIRNRSLDKSSEAAAQILKTCEVPKEIETYLAKIIYHARDYRTAYYLCVNANLQPEAILAETIFKAAAYPRHPLDGSYSIFAANAKKECLLEILSKEARQLLMKSGYAHLFMSEKKD